jgi:cytochrome c oxidase subunit 3
MSASVATEAQAPRAAPTGELGMWVFLATEVLFFSVLFVGYLVTRLHHPSGFALASRHTDVVIGSANTAVLMTSSLTMALAGRSLKLAGRRAAPWLLLATFALGAVFLALKLLEYSHDFQQHLVPGRSFALHGPDTSGARLFFLMYFVMTGAHAIHLMVGMTLVLIMAGAVWRGALTRRRAEPVEITALYWHLVDIVWIFLYPLLYLVSRT